MADRPPLGVRVALLGANGRMGRAIAGVAGDTGEIEIVAAVGGPGGDLVAAISAAEVVVDFSRADAALAHLAACRKARKALLLGTTGHGATLESELDAASREIALLVAPNTSLGIAVLLDLVHRAARALPRSFDVEVFDAHHRDKRDAPSGTALALGDTVARGRGASLAELRAPARDGSRVRRPGEIGFAAVRGGDIVGEHEVRFAGDGEELIFGHRATDRTVFARGAVKAAAWLAGRPPGRYEMAHVLGFKSIA